MRLWTFQHPAVHAALKRGRRFHANWERIWSPAWEPAYRWMIHHMLCRGIPCTGAPPIFAWHSGDDFREAEPIVGIARSLLTDCQIESGVMLMELDVPDHLVLLSRYSVWCSLIEMAEGARSPRGPALNAPHWRRMFDLARERGRDDGFREEHQIQACLPYLRWSWVRRAALLKDLSAREWADGCERTWEQTVWAITRTPG